MPVTTSRGSQDTWPQDEVVLGRLRLGGPVMPASGCFGPELAGLTDMSRLGAVVTKTVFSAQRSGNPEHRLSDLPGAMLNSVGIPSQGTDYFLDVTLPKYAALGPPVIVSVGGLTRDEYRRVVTELYDAPCAALELNVSCPNLEEGGPEIGSDPGRVREIVAEARATTALPLLVKLPPMVSSIEATVVAAAEGGADAVTVANSLPALALSGLSRQPALGNVDGGLTGAAIMPVTLRLVRDAVAADCLPVVGCGGIFSTKDALDYLAVGAQAVQIGTATFHDPRIIGVVAAELADGAIDQFSTFTKGGQRGTA